MAKRGARRPAKRGASRPKKTTKKAAARRSVKRRKSKSARPAQRSAPRKAARPAKRASRKRAKAPTRAKTSRLNRARRTLEDITIPSPPSSLDFNQRGTSARSGRAEMLDERLKHRGMNAVTAGDVDVNAEDAYFAGEEAPGGDNPTPDQDIVDDIGKALGVQYQDDEELQGAGKVEERDKHRWELDPASSEDYKGRK